MAAANWFRYVYLAHLSRPKGVRQLYRLVKRHQVCRIVEIGISDIARSVSLVEVAQRYARPKKVTYTAIDWFEARPPQLPPLSLKGAYRLLKATGASVRLAPGVPARSLAAAANAHQNTDLILIAPTIADSDLDGAWFYVPRMLHDESMILREQHDSQAEPVLRPLTRSQVADWACRDSVRRAA